MNIRRATIEDLPAITIIYESGTRDGRSYDLPNESSENLIENRKKWFSAHDDRYSVFVAEQQGNIMGWISIQQFDPRIYFSGIGEISIYVDPKFRGRGVGKSLFDHIFTFAKANNFHKIIAVCYPDNPAIHLKLRMGFKIVGTYHRHHDRGNGNFCDLHILEKYL